jgi:hypothetical protein
MFANLKSLLSNHVAPGGAIASASPFSFFARVEAYGAAGEDAKRVGELASDLMEVDRLLDADNLVAGRDRLKAILRGITE